MLLASAAPIQSQAGAEIGETLTILQIIDITTNIVHYSTYCSTFIQIYKTRFLKLCLKFLFNHRYKQLAFNISYHLGIENFLHQISKLDR